MDLISDKTEPLEAVMASDDEKSGQNGLRPRRPLPQRRHKETGFFSNKQFSRRSKILLLVLGMSWVLIFFMALFFGTQLYTLQRDNRELKALAEEAGDQLKPLQKEVAALKKATSDMLAGRLPGLKPLEYDQVITLDEGFLRNIVFNRVKRGNKTFYEYRLIVENNGFYRIWPVIEVFFFDQYGIQVADSQVTVQSEGDDAGTSLGPREARSYSDQVDFTDARQPTFFMVRADLKDQSAIQWEEE